MAQTPPRTINRPIKPKKKAQIPKPASMRKQPRGPKKARKWPRIVLSVLVVLFLAGTLTLVLLPKFVPDQAYIPQSVADMPKNVITAVVKPFQQAFSWAVGSTTRYFQEWKFRKTLEIEYNKLRQQNDQLIYASLQNVELQNEVDRLNDLMDEFYVRRSMTPLLAHVTAKEAGNWFSVFTIDKGEIHGIKKDMAVINEDGLIGRVYEVFKTTSQVVTIIDSRSSIGGVIESTRDQGSVKGTLGVEDTATCRMYYLPINLIPRPGDTVVTSGVGLPFPKGLKIGVVRESTRHMDENKQYVVVEPEVDFQNIEEVLVLIYDPNPEEMPAANDGQLAYVPAALDTPRPTVLIGEESIHDASATLTPPPRPERAVTPGPGTTLPPGATPTPTPGSETIDESIVEDG